MIRTLISVRRLTRVHRVPLRGTVASGTPPYLSTYLELVDQPARQSDRREEVDLKHRAARKDALRRHRRGVAGGHSGVHLGTGYAKVLDVSTHMIIEGTIFTIFTGNRVPTEGYSGVLQGTRGSHGTATGPGILRVLEGRTVTYRHRSRSVLSESSRRLCTDASLGETAALLTSACTAPPGATQSTARVPQGVSYTVC